MMVRQAHHDVLRQVFLRKVVTIFLVFVFSISVSAASGDAGEYAGSTLLRMDIDARGAALGGAMVSATTGIDGIRYNPAGLADINRVELALQRNNLSHDIDGNYAALALPTRLGNFGLGITYVNYGKIRRTTTADKSGSGGFEFAANDILARLAYGRKLTENLYFGVSIGLLRLNIDRYNAVGTVVDLGAKYQTRFEGIELAAALRNLGTKVKFVSLDEELPATLSLGGIFRLGDKLMFTSEVELISGGDPALHFGTEFSPMPAFTLRLGWDGRDDAAHGLTTGIGFAVSDLHLDYAFVPRGDLGESHRFSAKWKFGNPDKIKPKKTKPAVRVSPIKKTERSIRPRIKPKPEREVSIPVSVSSKYIDNMTDTQAVNLAGRRARQGQIDEAKKIIAALLSRNPDYLSAHHWLANIYYMNGEWTKTTETAQTYLLTWPDYVDGWILLGNGEYKRGRFAAARAAWVRALKLDPENKMANKNLSLLGADQW